MIHYGGEPYFGNLTGKLEVYENDNGILRKRKKTPDFKTKEEEKTYEKIALLVAELEYTEKLYYARLALKELKDD